MYICPDKLTKTSLLIRNNSRQPQGEEIVTYVPEGQQQFLYQPGRAMPLTAEGLSSNQMMKPANMTQPHPLVSEPPRHIWEQPLPEPGRGTSTEASGYQTGTMPTMILHGGVTVPGDNSVAGDTLKGERWPGTQQYYNAEQGWVPVKEA